MYSEYFSFIDNNCGTYETTHASFAIPGRHFNALALTSHALKLYLFGHLCLPKFYCFYDWLEWWDSFGQNSLPAPVRFDPLLAPRFCPEIKIKNQPQNREKNVSGFLWELSFIALFCRVVKQWFCSSCTSRNDAVRICLHISLLDWLISPRVKVPLIFKSTIFSVCQEILKKRTRQLRGNLK